MMNSYISLELCKLKLYLQRYPQRATELAIAHFEDYLVLISEYEQLDELVYRLKRSDLDSDSTAYLCLTSTCLSLEQEFRLDRLRRYLHRHPTKSTTLAVIYFHNYLILAKSYQQLEAEFLSLKAKKSSPRKPSLPYFL